jgi:hypothetical protein
MDTIVDLVAMTNITFYRIKIYLKCEMTYEVGGWKIHGSACPLVLLFGKNVK